MDTDEIITGSGSVYADLDIPEPKHGAVRRNGDEIYVWDSALKVWVQTKYTDN